MEKYTVMAHGSSAQCLLNTTPHRELAYTLVATFNKLENFMLPRTMELLHLHRPMGICVIINK